MHGQKNIRKDYSLKIHDTPRMCCDLRWLSSGRQLTGVRVESNYGTAVRLYCRDTAARQYSRDTNVKLLHLYSSSRPSWPALGWMCYYNVQNWEVSYGTSVSIVKHLPTNSDTHNAATASFSCKTNTFRKRVKNPPPSIYCNLSEDIQQLCWRSQLTACSRYIQWYISYFKFNHDWCLAPHRWGFYITHSDAPQSVWLLWTSGQLVAETSTWQHTTLTTDRHPGPRWDLKPRSQGASGRRPRGHWDRIRLRMQLQARELEWGLSVNKWSDVKWSDVEWTDAIYVKWFLF
jgi:hypothetical protein